MYTLSTLHLLLTAIIIASSTCAAMSEEEIFIKAYEANLWYGDESRSGIGASLRHTTYIREYIPLILKEFNIHSVIDLACGDWHWQKEIDWSFLDFYLGIDIVPALIKENKRLYTSSTCSFLVGNAIIDPIPKADLILCRSLCPLLFYEDIMRTINNIKRSGSKYLLITTYPMKTENIELPAASRTVVWARPLNLERAPFYFPEPLLIVYESNNSKNPVAFDKSLALWHIEDVPSFDDATIDRHGKSAP